LANQFGKPLNQMANPFGKPVWQASPTPPPYAICGLGHMGPAHGPKLGYSLGRSRMVFFSGKRCSVFVLKPKMDSKWVQHTCLVQRLCWLTCLVQRRAGAAVDSCSVVVGLVTISCFGASIRRWWQPLTSSTILKNRFSKLRA
jgi:hypothetical protein